MSNFKEYLRECVRNKKQIIIEARHLNDITFENLCYALHHSYMISTYMSTSMEVSKHPLYESFRYRNNSGDESPIEINGENDEVLVILFMCIWVAHNAPPIYKNGIDQRPDIYKKLMSAAIATDTYMNSAVLQNLIGLIDPVEYQSEEAGEFMKNYFNRQVKSAR